jgi:hypothetical protein
MASSAASASASALASAVGVASAPALVSAPTASVAEQARARFSHGGIRYIKVEELGTVPCNRSGLGVSDFHVHEVVASIKADGLSRRRYRDATVVRVPDVHMEAFLAFNKTMCESDDLLPAFSPSMRYACLTKNRFAHAVKLFDAGSAHFHGTKELIKPNPADRALAEHLAEGVACEVMKEELWLQDFEGLQAMVGEDNLDAATDLAASEMEVLQALRRLFDDNKAIKDTTERFRLVLTSQRVVWRCGVRGVGHGELV